MTASLLDRIGIALTKQREQYSDITNLKVSLNDAAIQNLIADPRVNKQQVVTADIVLSMTLFDATLERWHGNNCPSLNFKIGVS